VPSKPSAAAGALLFSSPFAAGTPCPPPSSPASASSSSSAAADTNPFTFDPDAAWAELQHLRAPFASPVMAEPLPSGGVPDGGGAADGCAAAASARARAAARQRQGALPAQRLGVAAACAEGRPYRVIGILYNVT
jgi:hypothetical protein